MFVGANVIVLVMDAKYCIVDGSFLVILSSGGIVGSSYVIASAAKWAMTCVFKNGHVCGLEFWYQSIFGDISIVIVYGSFWAPCGPSE